jgi:hypothetical protein
VGGLSKNQKQIVELLSIKPEMSTKEIAELLFLKTVNYKSKEYSSVHRSLIHWKNETAFIAFKFNSDGVLFQLNRKRLPSSPKVGIDSWIVGRSS